MFLTRYYQYGTPSIMKHLNHSIIQHKKKRFSHFLATGYVDNGFLGKQFIFSAQDAQTLQLPKMFPYRLRYLEQRDYHNGLVITPFTDAENKNNIPYGVDKQYLSLLEQNRNFVNARIEPVVGTVVFGRHKGLMFSLFGTKEIEEYFSRTSIQRVLRGERQFHRACIFQHTSHKDAIPFYGKLTKEVHTTLLCNRYLKSLTSHSG